MTLIKVGKYYHARFKGANGKVQSVTTHQTNSDDAAKMVKQSGITDLEMAARVGKLTADVIGRITTGKKLSIPTAIGRYLAWMTMVGKSPKTVHNCEAVLRRWAREAGLTGECPASIKTEHINTWINRQTSKASTRGVALSSIRSFIEYCSGEGWVVGNPAKNARVVLTGLSFELKEKKVVLTFTNEEIENLLLAAGKSQFWKFAISISHAIGLRLGDICQLEWACFSQPGKIVVWTDKRDKRIAVQIDEALSTLVTEIPISSPQYLFPEQRAMTIDPARRSNLSCSFSRLCFRAGIKGKSFHGLRHTRITEWAKAGMSLARIGEMVGHSDESTTKGYCHE